jgi:translocation and assembly module TamA
VLSRHVVILLAVLLLLPCLALAQQAGAYRVEIEGAGPYTELLTEHLDLVRRRNDTGLAGAEIERRVNAAPRQIRELLATQGYFSATVRHELERGTRPWTVRFAIDLGPPAAVESVDIRFRGALATGPHADPQRMRNLRAEWQLPPGDIFEQSRWTEAKSALLRGLLIRDFPAAAIVRSEARIDPAAHSAALTVEVDSGPLFTFGELDIHGLERYAPVLIERLNPIRPGQPYDQEKLSELQARVQETGYFRSAFATVEIDPQQARLAPVRLDVTELPRKRLALGAGISTDTGIRLQVRWLDRNFLERDWRLESELLLDRETRRAASSLFLRPLGNGWQPSVNAHLERSLSSGETNDKVRTGLRLTSPNRADEKAWALALMADRQRIGNTFETNRRALLASFVYTKRRMDNPLIPRRGYIASAELGIGPRGLVNEDNIARVVVHANALYPLGERLRLQTRGQLGQVFGGSRLTVPGDLLFRTGGDQSVRGYGYQTLGVAQSGAVVGGKVVAVASAELVYQLTPQWGAAVFVDVGDAADRWDDLNPVRGSGIGARWSSPIGQVNVDLAYGHATREPRLHFSIGYGF